MERIIKNIFLLLLFQTQISVKHTTMKDFNIIKWIFYSAVLLSLSFAFFWPGKESGHKVSKVTGHRSLSDKQSIQPDKLYAAALLDQLNSEKVQQDDPRLIKLIRDHFIEPPSPLPYNLLDLTKEHYSQYGQSHIIDQILRNKVSIRKI